MQNKLAILCDKYLLAKQHVLSEGYEHEILWQLDRQNRTVTETEFLKEASWVVLSSGMSERVVRAVFPKISKAFLYWTSASEIAAEKLRCRRNAMKTFGHEGKINAIIDIACRVNEEGFNIVEDAVGRGDVNFFQQFPYLGPATSAHLAKNLGLSIAKPDRHLKRIADLYNYTDVNTMCSEIALEVGDDVSEIDLVLWRFATIERDYLRHLSCHIHSNRTGKFYSNVQ